MTAEFRGFGFRREHYQLVENSTKSRYYSYIKLLKLF